jgi:phospholipid/cholesterol/gamma-HCH transport system ATP-binding protein
MKTSVINIKNLHKSFGSLDVLKGVNLDLYEGENLVVLGKSGTGKSVLIKIIAGLIKPDRGDVEVLGKRVDTLSKVELDELRMNIGFCFQNSALYDSMTIQENIEFPLIYAVKNLSPKEIKSRVDRVLEAVGLEKTRNQMPSELSGGQKKRIGIARTIVINPKIVLYDEPTAGLDPITCNEINQLINQVKEDYKASSIIITHDLTCTKQTADIAAVLLNGVFKKTGTFEEIFNENSTNEIKEFYDYNFIDTESKH